MRLVVREEGGLELERAVKVVHGPGRVGQPEEDGGGGHDDAIGAERDRERACRCSLPRCYILPPSYSRDLLSLASCWRDSDVVLAAVDLDLRRCVE